MRSQWLGAIPFAMIGALVMHASSAGTLVVLTSFPKDLTDTYRQAFERKHPDVKVEVLNKNTTAAIAYLRELPAGQRPDVVWVSSQPAFRLLARENLLVRAPEVRNPGAPAQIGDYPIDDPEGFFYGQALSGYGLMWNTRYLQARNLPAPKEWDDVATAAYLGHVAMSSPSLSGTTHMTVEAILQGSGWNAGWKLLLQIGGNCSAITDRSYSVPDGVNSGQYGVGLVIDFFGLASKAAGYPVEFAYPTSTAIVPASIGLVAGGRNPADARRFAAYTLSNEGQELLFTPRVSRMPTLPPGTPGLSYPAGYPDIFAIAAARSSRFDAELAEARYALVVSLFDQIITFRHSELREATEAIHLAQEKLDRKPHAEAARRLARARQLAFTPPIDETSLARENLVELFRRTKSDTTIARQISQVENQWSVRAKTNYLEAARLARSAARMTE